MRITDEMVEAACAALYPEAWRKSYYDHQRAAARADMRDALEAALAAAPPCKYIRSTGEGTHHCALAAAPHGEPVAWAQKEALEGVREYGEITCTLYAEGYQPEQEWTEPLYTAPQPEAVARAVTYAVDGMSVCLPDCVNTSEPPTAPDDKLREAARMALEALGQDNPAGRTATITALRAALGAQE